MWPSGTLLLGPGLEGPQLQTGFSLWLVPRGPRSPRGWGHFPSPVTNFHRYRSAPHSMDPPSRERGWSSPGRKLYGDHGDTAFLQSLDYFPACPRTCPGPGRSSQTAKDKKKEKERKGGRQQFFALVCKRQQDRKICL